jgi:hypothetical protein
MAGKLALLNPNSREVVMTASRFLLRRESMSLLRCNSNNRKFLSDSHSEKTARGGGALPIEAKIWESNVARNFEVRPKLFQKKIFSEGVRVFIFDASSLSLKDLKNA